MCAVECTPEGDEEVVVVARELVGQVGGYARGCAVGDEFVDGGDDFCASGWGITDVAIVPGVAVFAARNDAVKLFGGAVVGGVLGGVKVAVSIPSDVVGVAQATGVDFRFTAIGMEAQNGRFPGVSLILPIAAI